MRGRIALFLGLVLAQGVAWADTHSVAGKAGLLGLGFEYSYAFNGWMAVRAGVNGSKLGFDRTESGIDYEFDLVWDSWSLAVDFHPLRNPFRLTAGVLRNDNRLDGTSRSNDPVTIGDNTYTPEEVGTLHARVEFSNSTAPFIGIGWDWSRRTRLVGFSFDMGVAKLGSPRASLRGDGALLGDPAFAADIAREQAELQDALHDFDYLPYATFGVVFRF